LGLTKKIRHHVIEGDLPNRTIERKGDKQTQKDPTGPHVVQRESWKEKGPVGLGEEKKTNKRCSHTQFEMKLPGKD